MRAIFVQIKCEMGQAYRVAREAADKVTEMSELFSTSGQYDLIGKFYLNVDQDVGLFVTEEDPDAVWCKGHLHPYSLQRLRHGGANVTPYLTIRNVASAGSIVCRLALKTSYQSDEERRMGPVTRVGVTVTFLRMDQAPPTQRSCLGPAFQIIRAQSPSVPFYRYLYNTVGADYLWWLRRTTPDHELAALLRDKAVAIHTLYANGEPAGFFELDARTWARRQPQLFWADATGDRSWHRVLLSLRSDRRSMAARRKGYDRQHLHG